jgi:SAM-dependent methyltransferase
VLEHIDDLPGLFAEIARVLKPGGVFLFTCMSPRYYDLNPVFRALDRPGLRGLRRRMIEAENELHHHVSMFDRAEYEAMLGAAGFQVDLHQFFAPPDVTRYYALRDTLSKYPFPPSFRLTHGGLLVRSLVRRRQRNPDPALLDRQYAALKPLCYQRPPGVTMRDGAMQIFAARRL